MITANVKQKTNLNFLHYINRHESKILHCRLEPYRRSQESCVANDTHNWQIQNVNFFDCRLYSIDCKLHYIDCKQFRSVFCDSQSIFIKVKPRLFFASVTSWVFSPRLNLCVKTISMQLFCHVSIIRTKNSVIFSNNFILLSPKNSNMKSLNRKI